MTTNLIELYGMDKCSGTDFVKELSNEDLTSLLKDTTTCIKTIETLKPMYDDLYRQEVRSAGLFVGLWRMINKKARAAAEDTYNKSKAEIENVIKESKTYSLIYMFDKEMEKVISKHPVLTKEHTVVRTNALFALAVKLKTEISPICLAEVNNR